MVERRPTLGLLAHFVLIVGVLLVAFPVYLTFVASTHTAQEIVQAPMPMLPVEVRIGPTYAVVSDLHMLNSFAGLTIPLIASATATFLFRQFFLTVPDELVEAARMDGAGPMRFFKDVLLPLSATSMAALFVIQFIYGWNQYLWPLLVTTQEDMYPVVIGIKQMISGGDAQTEWNIVMATAMLAMLPPALVVMLMQKWFVKGLVDTEK